MKVIDPKSEHGTVWRNPKSVFKYNGWPSVICDDRGVLYAAASSFRIQHTDPAGKNAMFISYNGGKTWTCPIIVNDTYLDDRDAGIISLGEGKMIFSWFTNCDRGEGTDRFNGLNPFDAAMIKGMGKVIQYLPEEDTEYGAYVKVSDDYGVTWSEPISVPMTAPHGPNKLSDGRAIYLGKDMFPREDGEAHVSAYISSDGGRTWERVGEVPLPQEYGITWQHLHEPHVVELPSGRLLGAIRCHCRQGVEPADTCYTTYSDDGGKTWSVPKSTDVDGLPPHLLVHSSGAVILSYCCRVGDRRAERAAVSYDGGETWAEDYVVNGHVPFCDHGYPATAELPDGSLITVYYQSYKDDDNFCSVMYSKWRLQDK